MSSLCLFSPILDTRIFLFNSFSQVPLLCLNVTTIFCLEFVSLEVINYSLATKFIQLCLIQDLTCYAIFTMMSWDVIIYSCYHDFVVLWGGLPPLVLYCEEVVFLCIGVSPFSINESELLNMDSWLLIKYSLESKFNSLCLGLRIDCNNITRF